MELHKGIVKQVVSGDTIIIRGHPTGGPPPVRTLAVSNIIAPKLARRLGGGEDGHYTVDEPYAWESRECLRKLLIGKEVVFSVEYKANGGREYGSIWIDDVGKRVNIAELMISSGLAEVRQASRQSEDIVKLHQLESNAKVQGKGKWQKIQLSDAIRNVTWDIENLHQFVEENLGRKIDAIVEHVRDACTLKVMLIPTFKIITVSMTGIKCPTFHREGDKEVSEPWAEQAKFCTESRLLHRDVQVLIEGLNGHKVVVGTILHPAGNIAEVLLMEGFAWCVDWSLSMLTDDKSRLKLAERTAQEKKLRYWKNYQSLVEQPLRIPMGSKVFGGKVVEVINADSLIIKTDKGDHEKIFLSSVRPPKKADDTFETNKSDKFRPLYDIPYMFEAREFLRKKIIGKRVQVTVDYIKPAHEGFSERIYGTVLREGVNIAEALISKGLATCFKHGRNDDQRSPHYDILLTAESRAIKNNKGLHSKKGCAHRITDVSLDPARARQFLPFLQRAGRTTAIVEFVVSASRFKLYLPRDSCLITFILAGISVPKHGKILSESFGEEALLFTKELILQHDVDIEVDTLDKGGNFVGWLFIGETNIAVAITKEGFSNVLSQAERSPYARQLFSAQESAKSAHKNLWEGFVEPLLTDDDCRNRIKTDSTQEERSICYEKVVVTEVLSPNCFWCQKVEQGAQLEQMMEQLRAELSEKKNLPITYLPCKGDVCAAQFNDGLWYRAVVEEVINNDVTVLYIDFGNKEVIPASKTFMLPPMYSKLPSQAKQYYLACVKDPLDDEWAHDACTFLKNAVMDKVLLMNIEYTIHGQEYVTLVGSVDEQKDIAETMIAEGLLIVDKQAETKMKVLIDGYLAAEQSARQKHINIWQYGDFTTDDTKQFI